MLWKVSDRLIKYLTSLQGVLILGLIEEICMSYQHRNPMRVSTS